MGYFGVPAGGGGGGGGGGDWRLGALLWEWNKTDVSQFEAQAHPFERDLGTPVPNAATALALGVVDRGRIVGNTLRITATALAGGGVFGILESELTLPERYVMFVRWIPTPGGNTSLFPVVFLSYTPDDGAADFQGFGFERSSATSTGSSRNVVNNRASNSESLTSVATPINADRRGCVDILETYRVQGDPAASAFVGDYTQIASSAPANTQYDTALPVAVTGVGTNWNGKNLNRAGFGCWEGVNNTTGLASIELMDLKVYAHPDD